MTTRNDGKILVSRYHDHNLINRAITEDKVNWHPYLELDQSGNTLEMQRQARERRQKLLLLLQQHAATHPGKQIFINCPQDRPKVARRPRQSSGQGGGGRVPGKRNASFSDDEEEEASLPDPWDVQGSDSDPDTPSPAPEQPQKIIRIKTNFSGRDHATVGGSGSTTEERVVLPQKPRPTPPPSVVIIDDDSSSEAELKPKIKDAPLQKKTKEAELKAKPPQIIKTESSLPSHIIANTRLRTTTSKTLDRAPRNICLSLCPSLHSLFEVLTSKSNLSPAESRKVTEVSATYSWNKRQVLLRKDEPNDWMIFTKDLARVWENEPEKFGEGGEDCEVDVLLHVDG